MMNLSQIDDKNGLINAMSHRFFIVRDGTDTDGIWIFFLNRKY